MFEAILAVVVVVVMLAAAGVAPPQLSHWSMVGQLETELSYWSIVGRVQTTNVAATPSPHQTPVQCAIHNFSNQQLNNLPAL